MASDLLFGLESAAGSKSPEEVIIEEEEFELESFLAKHEHKIDS